MATCVRQGPFILASGAIIRSRILVCVQRKPLKSLQQGHDTIRSAHCKEHPATTQGMDPRWQEWREMWHQAVVGGEK